MRKASDTTSEKLRARGVREFTPAQWVKYLPGAAANLRTHSTYQAARRVCSDTRAAWTAYYTTYGRHAQPATRGVTSGLRRGLKMCHDELERCVARMRAAKADRQEIEDVSSYVENVAFRLKCLDTLTTNGDETVEAA